MKQILLLLFIFIGLLPSAFGQYFLRGIVKDEKGNSLPEVRIKLFSAGRYPLTNGEDGTFGFTTRLAIDTMYLNLDGYEPLKVALNTNQYNVVTMKLQQEIIAIRKNKLSSKTKDLEVDKTDFLENTGESYTSLVENDFVKANTNPETGFTLNVDRAAYSNIRRFINNEMTVPVDAVRIEEMLNYFDFRDAADKEAKKITCKNYLTTCPWNKNNNLLFIEDGLHRRSHRNFGFSESNVTADQAIHRILVLHIFQNIMYRSFLVRSFLKWKCEFKLFK